MVLGVLSLSLCPFFLGPVAWIMGNRAKKEIDASGGAIGGGNLVTLGYICGIVSTILMIVLIVLWGGGLLVYGLLGDSHSGG